MAVTRWRPLEEYHPAVRLMVRYMWRQEPPLLPSGFADKMGVPRQLVSRWLQVVHTVEDSETTDASLPSMSPPMAVRLARAMGMAPKDFLLASGMSTPQEPLFSREDAWDYVMSHMPEMEAQDGSDTSDGESDEVAIVRRMLEAARAADLERKTLEAGSDDKGDTDTPDQSS